jgi:hypothetical protein
MKPLVIAADGAGLAFHPQPVARAGHRMRAVVRARLVDELTGLPPAGRGRLASSLAGFAERSGLGGIVGLAGNPGRILTDLAANGGIVPVTVSAPRYLPRELEAVVGLFNTGLGFPADFPDHFEPADLGDVAMHRAAAILSGRVMLEIGADRSPLANVEVRLTGLWRSEPGPDDDPGTVMEPADLMALAPGLYRERAIGDTVQRRPIALGGNPKRLLEPVVPGSARLRVSDAIGLAVGDLLALDPDTSERSEYLRIEAIAGGAAPADPAQITLAYPPVHQHRGGTLCDGASTGAPIGAADALLRAGIPGDRALHLDDLPAIPPVGATVEISSAGPPEYQRASEYRVETGSDGVWRFAPFARVARARIEANRADFPEPLVAVIGPDYAAAAQQLDFVRRP